MLISNTHSHNCYYRWVLPVFQIFHLFLVQKFMEHSWSVNDHSTLSIFHSFLRTEMAAILNKEGEMPTWEIPKEWKNPQALSDAGVTLYSMTLSPPCNKIITVFKRYGVQYKVVDGKKKGSEYKKVPVLDIGDKQINDSYVILRVLAEALGGTPYTEEEIEIERLITEELMVQMEISVMDGPSDIRKCGAVAPCPINCIFMCCSCLPSLFGLSSDLKRKEPVKKSIAEYHAKFSEILGTKDFFHGDGTTAGVIDCSLHGVMEPFRVAGTTCYAEFLGPETSNVFKWNARMLAMCQKGNADAK